ncbi:MAG: type VII secretion target [Pseudonocardia sp.]|nr:type VII secretion target [Pseudonocardia sp.]
MRVHGAIAVRPADLVTHAGHVEETEAAIGRAAAASASPGDSYGLVGRVFALDAILAVNGALDGVDELRRRLTAVASGLRESAATYEGADRAAAARLGEAAGVVGGPR